MVAKCHLSVYKYSKNEYNVAVFISCGHFGNMVLNIYSRLSEFVQFLALLFKTNPS
jgi:hypothetical protein